VVNLQSHRDPSPEIAFTFTAFTFTG